ncbi:MAG: cysteine desulfurase [archaeon]|jgi:cysteine desulfurase/selenocysteine lyase
MNFEKYRLDFPVLKTEITYLDSAATSLKPVSVVKAMDYYYLNCPANIHRGVYKISQEASVVYEEAHQELAKFFNCKKQEVILTHNSTDSLNMIMYMLYNSNYFKKGDEILTTVYEHHANLVPWQFISQKLGLKLKFVEINKDYTFNLDDLEKKITNKTKLITVAHISNTIATIAPIKEIVEIAKKKNILVCVDGSQSAPHRKIDFKKLNVDFFVCTMHKMLGPTGVGVLIGKERLLEKFSPVRFGGDMIEHVTFQKSTWNQLPNKFEAGTPNISGAFGTLEAINYLKRIGIENIEKQDKQLTDYALTKLNNIPGLTIYNPMNTNKQGSIILFDLKGINSRELSSFLDEFGNIATRAGVHCAEPIVSRLNKNGLVRASFYFYNTKSEIDHFEETLKKIKKLI